MQTLFSFLNRKITMNRWVFINTLVGLFVFGLIGSPLFQSCTGNGGDRITAGGSNPLVGSSDQSDAISIQKAFHNVSKYANPTVVYISTEKKVKIRMPFGSFPFGRFGFNQRMEREHIQKSLGSGFILSSDGYIVTNHHVIDKAQKILVKVENEKEYKAKVVGTDPLLDLALLKIDARELSSSFLGDSDKTQVGDWAIAVGNPYGLSHTFTIGVISHIGRKNIDSHGAGEFIQTDASINPGNSGGPLLNIRGEVIGINRMIYSQSGGSIGIGFAIPINVAKEIIDQLKKTGKVMRGWLGVLIKDQLSPESYRELGFKKGEGIFVAKIVPGSPADKAGIREQDIIKKFNDKKISSFSDLSSQVKLTYPGKTVPIIIQRNKKEIKLWVTIKEFKQNN